MSRRLGPDLDRRLRQCGVAAAVTSEADERDERRGRYFARRQPSPPKSPTLRAAAKSDRLEYVAMVVSELVSTVRLKISERRSSGNTVQCGQHAHMLWVGSGGPAAHAASRARIIASELSQYGGWQRSVHGTSSGRDKSNNAALRIRCRFVIPRKGHSKIQNAQFSAIGFQRRVMRAGVV